jgi:hypothetical protein
VLRRVVGLLSGTADEALLAAALRRRLAEAPDDPTARAALSRLTTRAGG